jgi:uncharacterized surface protein with fasciclin (FAS1) repeats
MHPLSSLADSLAFSFRFPEITIDLNPIRISVSFGPQPTIADRLERSGEGFDHNARDFDILNAALDAAGLTGALDDRKADLTLFAPTDAAFIKLAQSFGFEGDSEQGALDAIVATLTSLAPDGNPIPLLTKVLTYHVAPESLSAREIAGRESIITLSGDAISPFGRTLGDLDPTAADPRITRANIDAANGTIQVIDRVLLPADLPELIPSQPALPTIADLVEASGTFDRNRHDYDILNAALDIAGLKATLADPSLDVTLLAPTDAAFLRLAHSFGYEGRDEGEALGAIAEALAGLSPDGNAVPLLTDILLYHVLDGSFSRQQLQANGEATTLLGPELEFEHGRIVDAEPDVGSRFVSGQGNVQAENGAIQGISGVLLPLNLDVI